MSDAYNRRLKAVMAGHRGDDAAAEQLLADEEPSVRAAALGALARCGALTAAHVSTALQDPATQVRCRAAELAPPDMPLVHLLTDENASVVEAAATALGERDWDATPVSELCRIATGHDDALCRESAVAALGAIAAGLDTDDDPNDGDPNDGDAPHDETGSHIAAEEHRSVVTHRSNAAPPENAPPDADAMHASDDGWPHRVAARSAALEVLLAAMDDRPQIRRRALLGLHQFADGSAESAVRAALDDNDRQVRAVAGELLGVPVR